MTKHTYKLVYVDHRGRAECIRLMFRYFNTDFEDARVEITPEVKEQAPMKQVPFLELDGGKVVLCQSVAICRYLAKSIDPEVWFGGATKTDSAKVDMYADAFADVFNMSSGAFYSDPSIREKSIELFKVNVRNRLTILEGCLAKSKGQYFVGKKVHWCDIYALAVLGNLEEVEAGVLDHVPLLRKYYLHMRDLPEIRDYIQSNWPATTYTE